MSGDLNNLVNRLEIVANKLENIAGNGSVNPPSSTSTKTATAERPQSLKDLDVIIDNELVKFLTLCNTIGSDVAEMGKLVKGAFNAQTAFIELAVSSKKITDSSQLQGLLKPISEKMTEIEEYRNSKRSSALFNHLSAISESISALGWVCIEPAPGPHVKEMLAASQFYSNRVLKDHKEKDANHVEWVKSWTILLNKLQEYIKQHHTTGVVWNSAPGYKSSSSTNSKPAGPPAGGIPPPPPMTNLPPPDNSNNNGARPGEVARGALFAELNRGADVTAGLKKVTKDMQTHKNPALRAGCTVPASTKKASPPPTAPKPGTQKPAAPQHPPSTALQGNKWNVEYYKNNNSVVVDDTLMKHTVYIYKCENSTIMVKGKVNSVVLDGCKKCGLVLEDLISALDVINCQSVKAQITGLVPTVNIDKTDGCQIYLSQASADAEFVTAKSSEMNVLIPCGQDGDFVEFAIPEQYRTKFDGKKLKTDVADSV